MANDVKVDAGEAAAILEFLPDAADLLRDKDELANGSDGSAGSDGSDGSSEEVEEAGEESEDDAAGDETDDSGDELEEKPQAKDKVQARIDKLTARAKSAEEERDELKEKISELETKVPEPKVVVAPSASNPLADVENAEQLTQKVDNARAVKRWCIENPEGGTVQNKDGEEVEIDTAAARRMLADAEEVLTVHAPRRERFLTEKAGHEKAAREIYPEMFKKGTEAAKAYTSLIEAWPEVTRFPDYSLVLGDYIAGFNARQKGKKPAEAAAPVKRGIAPPVPKVTTKKPSATRGTTAGRVISEGGSLDALTEYFAG